MLRRHLLLALIAAVICTLLLLSISNRGWRLVRHSVGSGFGGPFGKYVEVDPNAWKSGRERGQFKEPKADVTSPYPTGKTKPAGSNYIRTLVVAKLKDEDTGWIQEELGDMLASGLLNTAIYTLDDLKAALHPVENKGHEVIAYLSYIIDFYSTLPDIAIFMHAHRYAGHNNAQTLGSGVSIFEIRTVFESWADNLLETKTAPLHFLKDFWATSFGGYCGYRGCPDGKHVSMIMRIKPESGFAHNLLLKCEAQFMNVNLCIDFALVQQNRLASGSRIGSFLEQSS